MQYSQLEFWDDIPGYEGYYQVSTLGRVKGLERKVKHSNGTFRLQPEKLLQERFDIYGYIVYNLYKEKKMKTCKAHRLVALTFLPRIEGLDEVDHINRIRHDNSLENLRWATSKMQQANSSTVLQAKYYVIFLCSKSNKWLARWVQKSWQTERKKTKFFKTKEEAEKFVIEIKGTL